VGTFGTAPCYPQPQIRSRLSSLIISHFLLNLRQLTYGSRDDEVDTCLSFVRPHGEAPGPRPGSLRFSPFVDDMGADLDYGFPSADSDTDWDAVDDDADDSQGASGSLDFRCDTDTDADSCTQARHVENNMIRNNPSAQAPDDTRAAGIQSGASAAVRPARTCLESCPDDTSLPCTSSAGLREEHTEAVVLKAKELHHHRRPSSQAGSIDVEREQRRIARLQ